MLEYDKVDISEGIGINNTFIIIIDGIYCCFFCFLYNQENLYMIQYDADLFYDLFNTINEHNQEQNHYLLVMFPTQLHIFFRSNSKGSLITSLFYHKS